MRRRWVFSLLSLCLVLTLSTPALAQTRGTIRGRVVDADGSPLPGVLVTVSSGALIEGSRSMTTGVNGTFNFAGLAIGDYTVRAELQGFQVSENDDVRVGLEQVSTVNFELQLTGVEETVTVTGQAPVVDVTSSALSTNFNQDILDAVPTTRNFYDMIQAAPGMSNSWKQGTSDRTVAFGSNQQSNAWHVDGINNTAPETGSSWVDVNPDAIAEIQVVGVGVPAEYGNMTGGAFNIITKSGGNEFHGTGSYYGQYDSLTGTNVTLTDSAFPNFERVKYREFTGTFGGPIARDRLWFFASARSKRERYAEPRDDPSLAALTINDTYDLKLSARLSDSDFVDVTGHYDNWDFPPNPDEFTAPSALTGERGTTPSWSAKYRRIFDQDTFMEVKYGGWWADDFSLSRTNSLEPALIDYTPPGGGPTTIAGGAWWPWKYVTWNQQFSTDVSTYAQDFLSGDHDLKFGVQYSYGSYDTKVAAGATGTYYYHYYGYYYQGVNDPYAYGGDNKALGLFVDDSFSIGDSFTLNVGIRGDKVTGDIPDYARLATTGAPGDWADTDQIIPGTRVVDWTLVSPRVGFAWLPTEDGQTVVRGSFGVYYDQNVGGNWDAPPVDPPPYQLYWLPNFTFANRDTSDRELIFEALGSDRTFDNDLKAPRALQYALGLEHQIGNDVAIGVQGVYKSTKNLIGWEWTGGAWDEVPFTDPFTGTGYTLWSQTEVPTRFKGNQPGANPTGVTEPYWQKYWGVILTFNKRMSDGWSMQASYTRSKSWGLIPRMLTDSQFNPFYGGSDGNDPNNYINANQRLQADRPHMLRLAGTVQLPGGVDLSSVINIQSGRAYNRQTRVGGLGQGTVRVIMDPAGSTSQAFGELRYPTEKRVDLSAAKTFALGDVDLKIDAQVFNLLNEDTYTLNETLVLQAGDEFLRTDFFWPRRLMLRLGLAF